MELSYSDAIAICGKLSSTSKMPCPSYSLPAKACITGQLLAGIPGTVCNKCYALKGRYPFGNVQKAMQQRLESITHPQWVDAMVRLIKSHDHLHFRWHDSGDIQSVAHLINICNIARRLPQVNFWLPTRELAILTLFMECNHSIPDNLTIRISATLIDGRPTNWWEYTSTVVTNPLLATCPAPKQQNKCGACRACWDKSIKNIAYLRH